MSVSRAKAWNYAENLLSIPSRHVPITLRNGKTGVVVLHKGRVVTRCYSSRVGRITSRFLAESLGLELPSVGQSFTTNVSTGVLFRAISIAALDIRKRSTFPILERMIEEAAYQRISVGEIPI